MHHSLREIAAVPGISKTEDIGVGDYSGPQPRTCRVPVAAHYPGYRTSVRIESRRRVVGFYFESKVIIFIEFNDTRIVLEDRHEPALFPGYFIRSGFYIGLKDRVYGFGFFFSAVLYRGVKNLVFAVLRLGLSEYFELHIRRPGADRAGVS